MFESEIGKRLPTFYKNIMCYNAHSTCSSQYCKEQVELFTYISGSYMNLKVFNCEESTKK